MMKFESFDLELIEELERWLEGNINPPKKVDISSITKRFL